MSKGKDISTMFTREEKQDSYSLYSMTEALIFMEPCISTKT
jgi:hypothetical protein